MYIHRACKDTASSGIMIWLLIPHVLGAPSVFSASHDAPLYQLNSMFVHYWCRRLDNSTIEMADFNVTPRVWSVNQGEAVDRSDDIIMWVHGVLIFGWKCQRTGKWMIKVPREVAGRDESRLGHCNMGRRRGREGRRVKRSVKGREKSKKRENIEWVK